MEVYAQAEYSAARSYEWFDAYHTIFDLIAESGVTLDELLKYGSLLENLPCVARRTAGNRKYIVVHAGYTETPDNVSAIYKTLEDLYRRVCLLL